MRRMIWTSAVVAMSGVITAVGACGDGEPTTSITTSPDGDVGSDSGGTTTSPDGEPGSDSGGTTDARPCNGAPACARTVFVTKGLYSPDFATDGGITAADDLCAKEANESTLASVKARTWVAWISTSSMPAKDRHVHGTGPYRRPRGTKIADDWDHLTGLGGKALAAPIAETADGREMDVGAVPGVWTGTSRTGDHDGQDCGGWTMFDANFTGASGHFLKTTAWSKLYDSTCDDKKRLYCIEQ